VSLGVWVQTFREDVVALFSRAEISKKKLLIGCFGHHSVLKHREPDALSLGILSQKDWYVKINCAYTGCLRRNVPYFGRVFLMLKYTDITPNTYIQWGTAVAQWLRY
jgi:hypothetical protein